MNTLYHIVYVSSASQLFEKSELLALLEKSRAKNEQLGVTGMLLYRDGNFIAVIEGEETVVRTLMEHIARDPRHSGVITLLHEPISEREFPDWSMAFRDLGANDVQGIPGFSPFMNTHLTHEEFDGQPGKARKLLALFRKNNR